MGEKNTIGSEFDGVKQCLKCGAKLSADDKGIYMKLVTRCAQQFLCMDCLGEKLGCGRAALEERVKYYRESGNCVLFR